MTTPLLTDSSGNKIGKTEGNVIALRDSTANLYGKIMSLPDEIIVKGLEYLTDIPMERVHGIAGKIRNGENPMQFKKLLAFEVVKLLNSQNEAQSAQTFFEQAHQKAQIPTTIPEVNLPQSETAQSLPTILTDLKLTSSKSEAKRLLQQKGIEINGKTITSLDYDLKSGDTIKVGKHKYIRIK